MGPRIVTRLERGDLRNLYRTNCGSTDQHKHSVVIGTVDDGGEPFARERIDLLSRRAEELEKIRHQILLPLALSPREARAGGWNADSDRSAILRAYLRFRERTCEPLTLETS